MGTEIERKFLVIGDDWRSLGQGTVYRQGYIVSDQGRTVRVRVAGDRSYLTLKGPTVGLSRAEFEYEIPRTDADDIMRLLCSSPMIEKVRYRIAIADLVWEVDEFSGDNAGLIIAEVELHDEHQAIDLPPWIGQDVSGDPRYFNAYLAQHPFSQWSTSGD
ncbi:MAG: CYTH domain-containing protein [Synechococcales cyanobacterium K44_A2020_017]|jgi:adenylate cyclase|nr:CYTH domain-containing protein [Synechococcales cyanobacterium K44_A2020_017]